VSPTDRQPPEPPGLKPVSMALWLGAGAGVWLVLDVLRRLL